MWEILSAYWPHILGVVSLALTVVAASHAAMTKDEVRAAIGWVGVIVLSPIIGPLIYAVGASTASAVPRSSRSASRSSAPIRWRRHSKSRTLASPAISAAASPR